MLTSARAKVMKEGGDGSENTIAKKTSGEEKKTVVEELDYPDAWRWPLGADPGPSARGSAHAQTRRTWMQPLNRIKDER